MDIKNEITLKLKDYLKTQKKKTTTLDELQSLFCGDVLYTDFAKGINELIGQGILIPIKNAGISARNPRLPCKYKINSSIMREEYINDIERMAVTLHRGINLEYYFSQPQSTWEQDKENILKLDSYLKINGFPEQSAGSPERSYQIFGDEKFIDEKYGKRLLQRLRLYEALNISEDFDPAMFFINSRKIKSNQGIHKHLIIENRTPFYALSEVLCETEVTSLIYGAGFNILSSITMFEKQIDLSEAKHQYYYFGDLDYSGVSIWYYTLERVKTEPALPFYKALLERNAALGKEYQQPNPAALEEFLTFFNSKEKNIIQTVLNNGRYYPQEAIVKQELQDILTTENIFQK